MKFLSVDVGTTCCKCQVFSHDGQILCYESEEYGFLSVDGRDYVDVDTLFSKLKAMIKRLPIKDIDSVCISSLGESFVLLDEKDEILFYPMLYTDERGEDEAKSVIEQFGEQEIFKLTGVVSHSMYSLYKLLWIKANHREIFEKAKKVMLICDYLGYLLTGERAIDYALASRTGALDVKKLELAKHFLERLGISAKLFSPTARAGTKVGKLKAEIVDELGLKSQPVLVLGSHDQVCTTLGAGVLDSGEAVDGMGTVECITVVFDKLSDDIRMGRQGYPCVPYVLEGKYCTYVLNYSCGSTVNWLRKRIMHDYKGESESFFEYIERDMTDQATGILVLPYFGGASTPYQDLEAKGAILNLTTATKDWEVYKAIMEGTAMEMRLNAETIKEYGITVKSAVATGGGANSKKWLSLKSSIQNLPIKTLRSSEGGLCGCAMLQAVAMGCAKDFYEAKNIFVRISDEFVPNIEINNSYEQQYQKYKRLYATIKEVR